jgi:predicted nucleic acid-binding protein
MPDALLGKRVYLDSNVFIFAVESTNPWTAILADFFAAIDDRAVHAFTSELTLAEVLAKPLAAAANDLVAKYDQMLADNSVIDVVPVSRAILRSSAELQAQLGLKLADSIHVATAKHSACDFVLTNDEKLGRKIEPSFKWLPLAGLSARPSSA